MTKLRAVWALTSCLLLATACDDKNKSQNDAGTGSLDPPANIDAVTCYDMVSTDGTIPAACSSCCIEHGFPGSTLYQNHCVCGKSRDDSGNTVCADQAASLAVCMTCCSGAGFSGQGWGTGGGSNTCTCHGRSDTAVCASALAAPNPSTACQPCCLNNGYLGSGYTGIGTPECRCLEP